MSNLREVKHFYSRNGNILSHCFYDHDKMHGEYKLYYENGQIDTHCFYNQSVRCGECKRFYKNGQTYVHCFYDQGKLHGEYKQYRKSGQIMIHCFYNQGTKVDVSALLEDPNNPTETDIITLSLMFNGNILAKE